MSNSKSNDVAVIISHKDCWDGAASAWAASEFFHQAGRDVNIHYCQYGDAPPADEEIAGRDVYILDFSFPRETLLRLQGLARSLTVLDHHHTAKESLEGLNCCTFDMSRAGCQLTWDYFFPGQTPPVALAYVADRDLWRWEMPWSKQVAATLTGVSPSIEAFEAYADSLDANSFDRTVEQGEGMLQFFEVLYEKALNKAFYVELLRTKILFVPTLQVLSSELGSYAATRSLEKVACVFSVGSNGVTLSFRTVDGVDASPLAKMFGGGGHKSACGAKISLEVFTSLVNQNKPSIFEVMP